jgi:catechol 2,3-dioxygenase-like lactoylglutathione lyase family enzyme
VLLQATNLPRTLRFYESLLGTRGRNVGGGRVYFDCGPVILAHVDPSSDKGEEVLAIPEPVYFATTDLEGVYRRAKSLRCLSPELIHGDPENPAGKIVERPWGERSFYVVDPSGNPLCFVDSKTLFTGMVDRHASRARPRSRPNVRPRRKSRSS